MRWLLCLDKGPPGDWGLDTILLLIGLQSGQILHRLGAAPPPSLRVSDPGMPGSPGASDVDTMREASFTVYAAYYASDGFEWQQQA